jgi:hypothetical protein
MTTAVMVFAALLIAATPVVMAIRSLLHRPELDVPEWVTSAAKATHLCREDEVALFAAELDETDDIVGLLEQEGTS